MTTPTKPPPEGVTRWTLRQRWLRWADAIAAWTFLCCAILLLLGPASVKEAAVLSVALLCLGLAVPMLRVHWRPISGWVGLVMSRGLRPGHRAWYIGSDRVDLVLVTARRGVRLVIARPDLTDAETMSVRRTRVLLLPADGVRLE